MKATKESFPVALGRLVVRSRRRHGGYIVHLGIALIAFGIIGSNFDVEELVTLEEGESMEIADYTLTYEHLGYRTERANEIYYANIAIEKNGEHLGYIQPERVFYLNWPEPATEVAIRSTLKEDLYVVLGGWEEDRRATFQINVNPLVQWIWIGSALSVVGALFAIWPGRFGQVTPRYTGPQKNVH